MPIKQGLGFASDQISVLVGFDGSESKDLLKWYSRNAIAFPCRVACAINQYYPEMRSGFFLNKALIALIQDALKDIGFHVVIEDNYQEQGLVPEEIPGSLEIADDYLLVDQAQRICGRINVWESYGGKSEHYHDCLIMDILCGEQSSGQLQVELEKLCKTNSVAFFVKKGTEKPEATGPALRRFLRFRSW